MAEDNVVIFPGFTRLDIPPDRILESLKGDLVKLLIIGETEEGKINMYSSYADDQEVLWNLEKAKQTVLDM
jgi:hypothetical protein